MTPLIYKYKYIHKKRQKNTMELMEMTMNNIKMKNVKIVENVTPKVIAKKFANRLLRPEQIQHILPETADTRYNHPLFMGLAVCTEGPLGDYARNGTLRIEAKTHTRNMLETRAFSIQESLLPPEYLRKENAILHINGGFAIADAGIMEYEVTMGKQYLDRVLQFIRIYDRPVPNKDCEKPVKTPVYRLKNGMPHGFPVEETMHVDEYPYARSRLNDEENRFIQVSFESGFGSVLLGYSEYIHIGFWKGYSLDNGNTMVFGAPFVEYVEPAKIPLMLHSEDYETEAPHLAILVHNKERNEGA